MPGCPGEETRVLKFTKFVLEIPYFCVMLQRLSISNYALIRELSIDFGSGLTIITGETGAGKSVLLGALQLLLGERADLSVLRDPLKKCVIEASFTAQQYDLRDFFLQHDLDEDEQCILRREINPAGKSRAFINDTPVNLALLKELGIRLIDIHSQHDTLLLENSQFQLQLLDAAAGNFALLKAYRALYTGWKNRQKELAVLREQEQQLRTEQDFIQFQHAELEQARLVAGEERQLEEEFRALTHAGDIRHQVELAVRVGEDEERGVQHGIRSLLQALQPVARYSAEAEALLRRIESVRIELKDIVAELEDLQRKSTADPQRLAQVTERLDLLNHLLTKHRVRSTAELLHLQEQLEERLVQTDTLSEEVVRLEKELAGQSAAVEEKAAFISGQRQQIVPSVEKEVAALLRQLGMPKVAFSVVLNRREEPGPNGIDTIKILFSANAGSASKELGRVASGGELSRLMLALKKITARSVALPTIVFDEIDAGVSGAVADRVGELLHEMGTEMQVLAITHLPQIAGKGMAHLKVTKSGSGKEVTSSVRRLNDSERIDEIAALLSGKELSEAAVSNAKALLGL